MATNPNFFHLSYRVLNVHWPYCCPIFLKALVVIFYGYLLIRIRVIQHFLQLFQEKNTKKTKCAPFFLQKIKLSIPPHFPPSFQRNQFGNNSLAKKTFNILFKEKYQSEKGLSFVVSKFLKGLLKTSLVPLWLFAFALSQVSSCVYAFFLYFMELILLLYLGSASRKCFLHLIHRSLLFTHLQCERYFGDSWGIL